MFTAGWCRPGIRLGFWAQGSSLPRMTRGLVSVLTPVLLQWRNGLGGITINSFRIVIRVAVLILPAFLRCSYNCTIGAGSRFLVLKLRAVLKTCRGGSSPWCSELEIVPPRVSEKAPGPSLWLVFSLLRSLSCESFSIVHRNHSSETRRKSFGFPPLLRSFQNGQAGGEGKVRLSLDSGWRGSFTKL